MSNRYTTSAIAMALLLAACSSERADTAAGATDTAGAMGTAAPADTGMAAGMATGTAAPDQAGAMLDPDNATREQLMAVPGMTPAAADALIAGRPYADMRAADRALSTLSEAARDSVYARVWKPLDLNSATPEEITADPRRRQPDAARVRGVPALHVDGAVPAGDREVRGRGGGGAAGAVCDDQVARC